MRLKNKVTNKLFYKKWLYKVVINCPGLSYLCRKGIGYIQDCDGTGDFGWQNTRALIFKNKSSLLHIGFTLEIILKDQIFQKRVEGGNLAVFTNSLTIVDQIQAQLKEYVKEVHKPVDEEHSKFLISNKSTVLCNELPHNKYRFKIYFKNGAIPHTFRENFLKWYDKFDDGRIHVPKGTRDMLEGSKSYPYFYGQYFYAVDDKIASMAMMFLGEHLNKTEEHVLKSEI